MSAFSEAILAAKKKLGQVKEKIISLTPPNVQEYLNFKQPQESMTTGLNKADVEYRIGGLFKSGQINKDQARLMLLQAFPNPQRPPDFSVLDFSVPNQSVAPPNTISEEPNYEKLIRTAYQRLGGATPELIAQIPIMARAVQKNPFLYPYYPALPFAETSLGKNVPYSNNFFNWGVNLRPYPLGNQSAEYITQKVAERLATDPIYRKFQQNPSVRTLQESGYAPINDNNPYWLGNMESAINAFSMP